MIKKMFPLFLGIMALLSFTGCRDRKGYVAQRDNGDESFMPALESQQMTDYSLNDICYGEHAGFVAVGNSGHILFSADGRQWSHYKAAAVSLHAVCYGTAGFVAVGERGVVLYSADGKRWEPKGPGLTRADLKAVCASGRGYVAVGDSSVVLYSETGDTWTRVSSVPAEASLTDVFGSTLGFVAVGDLGTVLLSGSGAAGWKKVDIGASMVTLNSVSGNENTFIVGGEDSTLFLLSTEGQITPANQVNIGGEISSVTRYKNLWLAGRKYGGIIYSADGINWRQANLGAGERRMVVFSLFTGTDLAVAKTFNGIYVSRDGISWQQNSEANSFIISLAISPDMIAGVGENGFLGHLVNEEGAWKDSSVNPASATINAVFSNNKGHVAAGEEGQILFSQDGRDWEIMGRGLTENRLFAISGGENNFVIAGDSGTILSSGDGRKWEKKMLPGAGLIMSLSKKEDIMVATGEDSYPYYSAGGNAWTKASQFPAKRKDPIPQVINNGEVFLVRSGENELFYSADGADWKEVSLEENEDKNISRIVFIWEAAGRFYLFKDDGTVWVSENGKKWAKNNELSIPDLSEIGEVSVIKYKQGFILAFNDINDFGNTSTNDLKIFFSATGERWNGQYMRDITLPKGIGIPDMFRVSGALGRRIFSASGTSITEVRDVDRFYPVVDSAKVEREGTDKVAVYVKLAGKDQSLNFDSLDIEMSLYGVSRKNLKDRGENYNLIKCVFSLPDPVREPNTWKTVFRFDSLGIDPRIPDYSEFYLKLNVMTEGAIQHFDLRDHSAEYFALSKTKFRQLLDKYGIWILLILLYYAIILLIWLLYPLAILHIHQKLPLKDLVNGLPAPFNIILSFLGILFPISLLAYGRRCLDAWVKKNHAALKSDFGRINTVKAKAGYIPLPVRTGNELNGELIDTPTADKILPLLVDNNRNIVQIVGPGGSGKTSFACEIGSWLLDRNNRRYTNNVQRIPYFLEKNTTNIVRVISEDLTAVLQKPVSRGLTNALLKRQRLILFVDALSEMKQETIDYFQGIHGKTPVNSLLITGRNEFNFTRQDNTLIYPQPLNSSNLLFLISAVLQKEDTKLLSNIEDQLAFAQKIAALLKSGNKELAVRPILVRLVMDNLIADFKANQGSTTSLLDRIPGSIPQVYFDYLAKVNPQSPTTENYLSNQDMYKVAVIMGRLSLGGSFVPHDFSAEEAQQAIRKEVPHLDPAGAIDRMKKNGIITEKNVLDEYSLRFNLDPLAEFTGAKHYADECGSREGINLFIEEIINKLDDNARGFKQAFWLIVSPDSKYDKIFGWDQ